MIFVVLNAIMYYSIMLNDYFFERFCEADIVYRSRSTIGAPPGVRVYCLDGSLLMDEKDG